LFLIVSSSIILGSCGGGRGKPLTKAEFVARANAICVPFKKAVAKEIRTAGASISTEKDLSSSLRLLPIYKGEVAHLKALVPPVAEQKTFDRVIILSERMSSDITKLIAALRGNGNEAAWNLTKRGGQLSQKRDILFSDLGAMECITSTMG
jgi:hypothetical protein